MPSHPVAGPQLAGMLLAEGATPQQAALWDGIARRESGLFADIHSDPSLRQDDSFGLFMINMIGSLGPARRAQLGLASNEQLYDPATNVHAARVISNNWTDPRPWTVPGGTPTTGISPAAQAAAVADVQAAVSGNPQLPGASIGQTPVGANMPGMSSGSVQIPFGSVLGQTIGPTFEKAQLVKVGLQVLGGLLVLVGLYVAFSGGSAPAPAAPKNSEGPDGAPKRTSEKSAETDAEEVAAA